MPMELIDLLSKGSSIVLAVVVVALMTGHLVPRYVYKEMEKRAERFEELAMRGTSIGEEGVSLAEHVARRRPTA